MTEERARRHWNYYNRLSADYAQWYFTNGCGYGRAQSKRCYDLANRWRWVCNMMEARRVFKNDNIQELLKRFPEYYRVRPQ